MYVTLTPLDIFGVNIMPNLIRERGVAPWCGADHLPTIRFLENGDTNTIKE